MTSGIFCKQLNIARQLTDFFYDSLSFPNGSSELLLPFCFQIQNGLNLVEEQISCRKEQCEKNVATFHHDMALHWLLTWHGTTLFHGMEFHGARCTISLCKAVPYLGDSQALIWRCAKLQHIFYRKKTLSNWFMKYILSTNLLQVTQVGLSNYGKANLPFIPPYFTVLKMIKWKLYMCSRRVMYKLTMIFNSNSLFINPC